jgi:adenosine deaminase CECR1
MPMHPLPIMLNHGIPVALSSDDPSVFGNMGLTYDFFQVGLEVPAKARVSDMD